MANTTISPAANLVASKNPNSQAIESVIVAILFGIAIYCALLVAPTERTMGVIQRIFYFHMPFGITAFVAFLMSATASVAFLLTRAPKWDWLAVSSAEIGVPCISVMLVTGSIWAHPVWGVWWVWDARLTSTFLLWALYLCYIMLRPLIDDPERRAVVSAVFNIFAACDVPFVYFSIWFFRTQHPQPVLGDGGSLDPRMFDVLVVCWIASLGLFAVLLRQRYRMEALRYEVAQMRMEAERHGRSR